MGDTIDLKPLLEDAERQPIHKSSNFDESCLPFLKSFETGITVADLLAPYLKAVVW